MSRALNKNEKNAERVWHRITGAHFNLFNSHDILSTTPMSWLGLEMPACVRACVCVWVVVCAIVHKRARERKREKVNGLEIFTHLLLPRRRAHHRPRPPPAQRRRRRLGTGQHREPNIKRKKNLVMIEFFFILQGCFERNPKPRRWKEFSPTDFLKELRSFSVERTRQKSKFMTKMRLEWKWLRCVFIITL